jgi:hypothetical protein
MKNLFSLKAQVRAVVSLSVVIALWASSLGALPSWGSGGQIPPCLDKNQNVIPIENERVLEMKKSTPNQYKTQSHVMGPITEIYPDSSKHQHFAIQLGQSPDEGLEVIYNIEFGDLPELKIGMMVEACGEYITSNAPSRFPASPMGAIIHWVHINPRGGAKAHPSGFVAIDSYLYGQGPF